MDHTVSDVMQRKPAVVSPEWSVAELERAFFRHQCSGFPVVEAGALVGVVSRSDLVRRLAVERAREGQISDFFRESHALERGAADDFKRAEVAAIAERRRGCRVADLMSPADFVVTPETPIREAAALLVDHHIHRVPVVENDQLVGILGSLDLVGLLAKRD